jgi:hypothetical protein
MEAELLLTYLDQVTKTRCGWMTCCPAHEDRHPSLAIKQSSDRILIHCFAGCSTQSITTALGLSMKDLFSSSNGYVRGSEIPNETLIRRVLYNELIFSSIYENELKSVGALTELDRSRLNQAKARVLKAKEVFNEPC